MWYPALGACLTNKFFEGIRQYVWTNAQEDSKIEPAEIAEYSAIEQAVSIWWLVTISHYTGRSSNCKQVLRI